MARSPNAVLHEMRSASARVISPVGEQRVPPKFFIVSVRTRGYGSSSGAGTTHPGVYCPLSRAAAEVTIFNVEPGGYALPRMARFDIGLPSASSSSW